MCLFFLEFVDMVDFGVDESFFRIESSDGEGRVFEDRSLFY